MTTIKAGYRLTVSTWENDMDAQATNTVDGLTKEECAFRVELLKLFYSRNSSVGTFYGNIYNANRTQIKQVHTAIKAVYDKHNVSFVDEDDDGYVNIDPDDILYDMGITGNSEFFTRVLNTCEVAFVKETVVFEDVTKQFKKS